LSRLDQAPMWARILPGVLGLTLLAWTLGYIPLPSIQPLLLVIAALAVGVGLAGLYAVRRVYARGRRRRAEAGCYGYRLEVRDAEEASRLARIIEERAERGYAEYIVMSAFTQSGKGNILLICGEGPSLTKEKEIFETLVETVMEKIRLDRVSGVPRDVIGAARIAARGRDKGSQPSLISWISPAHAVGGPAGSPLVVLGRRVAQPIPKPVVLTEEDVEGHIGVFGSTGSGKSTTLAKIAREVSSKWSAVVVFDWTGEYERLGGRRLDPSRGEVPFDPFALLEEPGGVQELVDILAGSLGLSDPQAYMLHRILEAERPWGVEDLIGRIWSWPEESKWDREVKRGLVRRIGVLRQVLAEPPRDPDLSVLLEGLVVVDVSRIEGVRARRAYTLLLAAALYYAVRKRRGGSRVLMVFDEAHNIFMGGEGVFGEMMAESRKYGVSIAYATQAPSLVPDNVLVNSNTKIVHALRSQRDKSVIVQAMSLDDEKQYLLDKLVRGEALVQAPSIPEPVLVKIEP